MAGSCTDPGVCSGRPTLLEFGELEHIGQPERLSSRARGVKDRGAAVPWGAEATTVEIGRPPSAGWIRGLLGMVVARTLGSPRSYLLVGRVGCCGVALD